MNLAQAEQLTFSSNPHMKRLLLMLLPSIIQSFSAQADLPRINKADIADHEKLRRFVSAFASVDSQAKQLNAASNRAIYAEGFRPALGLPNDPDAKFGKTTDLKEYFARKLYLDLAGANPLTKVSFLRLADFIGSESDKTIIAAGKIIVKYDLNVEGAYNFTRRTGCRKIPLENHSDM